MTPIRLDALFGRITECADDIVVRRTCRPQADTYSDECYLRGLLHALHIMRGGNPETLDVEGAIFAAAWAMGAVEQQPMARAA